MIDFRPDEATKTPQFFQHFRSMTDSICCNRPKFDYHDSLLRSLLADDRQCGLKGRAGNLDDATKRMVHLESEEYCRQHRDRASHQRHDVGNK